MRSLAKLILALIPLIAAAQDNISLDPGPIGNGRLLGAKTYDGQTTVGVLGVDSNGNTVVKALSGKGVVFGSGTVAPSADSATLATFGYTPSSAFVPLVDVRTKQLLTGLPSGTEAGRGTVRLHDTIASPAATMELGFYQYGAGIFTDAPVFEIFAADVSVRQLTGSSPAFFEVRDATDTANIALKHDSTVGMIYTSGVGFPDGGISIRPIANETFIFQGRQNAGRGNITQNSFYGGSLVLTNTRTAVAQPTGDALTAAGTTITDALQLSKIWNNVSTAASGTGAKLWDPDDANGVPTTISGIEICTRNGGANDMVLYPPTTSDSINAGTAGHGILLTTANKQIGCCFKTATNKYFCTVQNSASVL